MREFVTDESDMATEVEMRERELSIKIAQRYKDPVEVTGFCNNCDEVVESPKKYCDADCASDHAKRLRK